MRHAGDVLEVLSALPPLFVAVPPAGGFDPELAGEGPPESEMARVREALSPHAMPLDEIARAASLSAARTGAILMELELAGEAITFPGGMAARAV